MDWKNKGSAALATIVASTESLSTALSPSPPSSEVAKDLLSRFFDLVCDLAGHVARLEHQSGNLQTDRSILQAWHGLLADTEKLSAWKGVDGHFIAARMILFISHAFREQFSMPCDMRLNNYDRQRVQAQVDLLFAIDEALLIELRALWDRSGRTEYFDWALTHMDRNLRQDHNRALMTCLTPAELLSVPGLKRATIWIPKKGEPPIFHRFREATASVSGEMDENHNRPLIRQTLYDDGPLRAPDMEFSLSSKRDYETIVAPRLARSKQFVLDARVQRYPTVVTQRNAVINKIARKYRLPVELQEMIAGKLEEPHKHPYISHLDLSAAYQPFPSLKGDPKQADETKPDQGELEKAETGLKTVYVWNYALRTFHVFHEQEGGALGMCKVGFGCHGHHAIDEDWKLDSYETFCIHLLDIVTKQCASAPNIGLSVVGVGAEFDLSGNRRDLHSFPHYGLEWDDINNEILFSGGGFADLPESMCAARVRRVCFRHEGDRIGEFVGNTTISDGHLWARGRSVVEEKRCQAALKSLLYEGGDSDGGDNNVDDGDSDSDEDSEGSEEDDDDRSYDE